MFFKSFLTFFLSQHPHILFRSGGSGSHFYTAQLRYRAVRSILLVWIRKTYIAHMGFGGNPLLSLTSGFIIPQRKALVNTFFLFFSTFFWCRLAKELSHQKRLEQTFEPYCLALCQVGLQVLLLYSPVLCWYLYYSTLGAICQELFLKSS